MEKRFNLVDEKWIPVTGQGKVSLWEIFSNDLLPSLGGTPVQKISIFKLLLAIAQRAYTPRDDEDWMQLNYIGMSKRCLDYLEDKKELFWLYGDKPFLQLPELRKREKNLKGKPITYHNTIRNYLPDLSSSNDTILFDVQIDREPDDAEKAVFLISLMNYAPGGKRIENIGALSPGYNGKGVNAKAGPSLGGYVGYLNSCLWSDSIQKTVFINLWTTEQITQFGFWSDTSTIPPWEDMPTKEDDRAALRIKNGIMGCLCAVSRFVLFTDKGMVYAEGIQYPSHKDGWREPFFSFNSEGKFIWLDTEKKPWRELISLLKVPMGNSEYDKHCPQIDNLWNRARQGIDIMGIWSGGLQVRGTAGDQSVKQKDDFVESVILLNSSIIGEIWFESLKGELELIEKMGNILYSSISSNYSEQKIQKSDIIDKAKYQYWEQTEKVFKKLITQCSDKKATEKSHLVLIDIVNTLYNRYCPNHTARQMTAWAKCKPKISKYYPERDKEAEIA